MIDLEQVKKDVKEMADHFRRIDSDKLLTLTHDLIAELESSRRFIESLQHERAENRVVLRRLAEFWDIAREERDEALEQGRVQRQQLVDLRAELLNAKKWLFNDNTIQVLRAKLNAAKAEIERLQNDSQQT